MLHQRQKQAKALLMVTCRFKSKKYIHSLEERAACLPLIVFKELTPGLKAFRAPLQHRPTAPNMVKMAEGEGSHSPVPFSPASLSEHAQSVVLLSPSLTEGGQQKPRHSCVARGTTTLPDCWFSCCCHPHAAW